MATRRPATSVVVPVLDESATLPELLRRLGVALGDRAGGYEVMVVDDGSRPEERDRIAAAVAGDDRGRLIRLDRNRGQVVALARGLAAATGDVVVTMDGDLQDRPEDVPALLEAVEAGAAVATARRAELHGAWWRRVGSRAMTRLTGWVVGVRLDDYGGQFNAYRRDAVDAVLASWRPRAPLLPTACGLRLAVAEVDVRTDPRPAGRSKHGLPMKVGIVADLVVHCAPRWVAPVLEVAAGLVGLAGVREAARAGRRSAGRLDALRSALLLATAAALAAPLVRSRRAGRGAW